MLKQRIRRMVAALCIVMTTTAFSFVPVSATEEPSDFGQYYGVVTASALNVRAGASTDSAILTCLPAGATVKVNWVQPGWICIAYNGTGLMGFVSGDYMVVYEGALPQATASSGGQAVIDIATQFLGVPYVYGGSSPSGFDCSGFTQYVYKQLGYTLNRVASAQMSNGIYVSKADLMPGDVVGFFSSPGSGYVGHVGIYVGNGMMIHAPHTGDVVKYTDINSSYYSTRFAGGRRIIY